jgi:hypothetical protein
VILLIRSRSHGLVTTRYESDVQPEEWRDNTELPCGGDWHLVCRGPDGLPCVLASCLTLAEAMRWRERFAGIAGGPVRVERHEGEAREKGIDRQARIAAMRADLAAGMSQGAVARKHGVTKQRVSQLAKPRRKKVQVC